MAIKMGHCVIDGCGLDNCTHGVEFRRHPFEEKEDGPGGCVRCLGPKMSVGHKIHTGENPEWTPTVARRPVVPVPIAPAAPISRVPAAAPKMEHGASIPGSLRVNLPPVPVASAKRSPGRPVEIVLPCGYCGAELTIRNFSAHWRECPKRLR